MSSQNNILQYQICIKCNSNLAKIGTNYCKKCRVKPINSNKTITKNDDGQKIYYYKFQNRNTKARLLLNNSGSNIGYSLCIEPSTFNGKGFQPIENYKLLLLPTWSQFRSLKEFATCIIRSDQISYPYFILSCNTVIQKLPKFQNFIQHREIDLPSSSLLYNLILPYPLTSSMQLICQASFWDELLSIYFKDFHPMCPLFSIQSFDRKTASSSLLTAINFCAYILSNKHLKLVSDYMKKLSQHNIKKIVKKATLDNLRALIIHTFMAEIAGKWTLAKSLQASMTRMSYLLGLHLEFNKLSPIDRYNRNLLFNAVRGVNIGLSGSHNFSPNYLTDFGKEDLNLYDTKWQHPIPSSPIYYENQLENQLYSICVTKFSKFSDDLNRTIYIPSFFNLETNTFNRIWSSKINRLKLIFDNALKEIEDLKMSYLELKAKIDPFQTLAKMQYYDAVIDMYEILKHKNEFLKPCEISITLDYCHDLYLVLTKTENYSPHLQFYAHIIGLHYLNIYPKCTESERLRTKQRLKDLILFIKDNFFDYFSLNYLLLKTGYDALDEY